MRDTGLLGLRLTLGGYLAVHGAQKLFGAFGGPGLKPVATFFEHLGLKPPGAMAALAGTSEFVGGLLTAAGLAYPVGPVAIAGAMTVATAVHGDKGPMQTKGGYELTLTNLVVAGTLIATGPGKFSLDRLFHVRLPKSLIRLAVLGAAALTAYNVSAVIGTRHRQAPEAVPTSPAPGAAANGSGDPTPSRESSGTAKETTDA